MFASIVFTAAVVSAAFAPAPATGKSPETFAPKGWAAEQVLRADLDGDPIEDAIVVLLQEDQTAGDRRRALLWLTGTAEGFAIKASNVGLLACYACLGMKSPDSAPQLEVKNRVLSVSQWGGARSAYGAVHRFRIEKDGRVRLIGADHSTMDTLTGDGSLVSENFLTGARVTDTMTKGKKRTERKKLPLAPLEALEDVTEYGE